ncbi:MAG: T9SS type A sorting domain-containing protein [Flavobacterium sp.]|jgi:aminopeptidase N|nr:T9SS type A sorting domain-containing protein [Flavobacterium sp.]
MKNFNLIVLLFISAFGYSQSEQEDFDQMVAGEMKSSSANYEVFVNPNTLNYDVTYHELRFTVNPNITTPFINGVVKTTFTALSNMNAIVFDMATQLGVSAVIMNGSNLTFSQSNYQLFINFPTTITSGTSATVEITYSGSPPQAEQAFTRTTHNGTPVIYTLSEPFGARDWWPCKQDLNDKIDNIDVYITCPSTYIGVSNGLLQSSVTSGGNTTRHFQHNYPIPAYLISLNVTNYVTYNIEAGLGTTESPFIPIINYLYPESNTTTVQNAINQTIPIFNIFEEKFGPYPYRNEIYGHVQFSYGGGMEHATMSSMGGWSRSLIAHELGHQWFGNQVTCGTWKDIWLNEGLTEYTAGIAVEEMDGPAAFVSWKANKINNITSQTGGAVYLTDSEALNVGRIFSGRLSYNKGSMVTHMLRWVMGDTAFFQALRNYLNDSNLSYGYAITDDLVAHLEAEHGASLTEFFNDWLYNQGYPTYSVQAQNFGSGQAKIILNQTQSHPSVSFFEMPVEVRLTGSNGQIHDVILNHTFTGQEFIVSVPFLVTGVEFDPNRHIISRNSIATLSNNSFEWEDSIVLYPNPSNDLVSIQMPTNISIEKVSFYNALGQKVMDSEGQNINFSSIANGVYLVEIKTNKGIIHKNFIKN